MLTKFRVIGAGVWGLAFSDYLLNLGHSVEIFRRDISLGADSIQKLGLKKVSSDHIKSLETLNDQKNNDEIKINPLDLDFSFASNPGLINFQNS